MTKFYRDSFNYKFEMFFGDLTPTSEIFRDDRGYMIIQDIPEGMYTFRHNVPQTTIDQINEDWKKYQEENEWSTLIFKWMPKITS